MEIKILENVLDANERIAEQSRRAFEHHQVFVLNVMSSPGAGKTLLLEKTLDALRGRFVIGVIVGDICTTNDAERLDRGGEIPVVQICTEPFGGACHLGAHVVWQAAEQMPLDKLDILIVENVGNLVCPAEFDIGEDQRVVVLSVTEGEDKPQKYPLMFRVANAAVLNKIDLLPHLDYDRELALQSIRSVNSELPVFELSARTGEGLEPWLDWIAARVAD